MAGPTLTGKALQLKETSSAYPLFVTSDKITPAIIDKFLSTEFKLNQVDKTHPHAISTRFYLVTDESVPDPSTLSVESGGYRSFRAPVETLSVPPTPSFKSPYIGKSVEQLLEVQKASFSGSPFANRLFIVFDERTARDHDTVLLVEETEMFQKRLKGKKHLRARCQFGYAAWSLNCPLVETNFLTEFVSGPQYADVQKTGDDKEDMYFGENNSKVEFICHTVTGGTSDNE